MNRNDIRTHRLEIASIFVAILTTVAAGSGVWIANRQADTTDAQLAEMRRSGAESNEATLRLVGASESQNAILGQSIAQNRMQTDELKRQADIVAQSVSVSKEIAKINNGILKSNQKSVSIYDINTTLNNRPSLSINISGIFQDESSKKWTIKTNIFNDGRSYTDYAFMSSRIEIVKFDDKIKLLQDCEEESLTCSPIYLSAGKSIINSMIAPMEFTDQLTNIVFLKKQKKLIVQFLINYGGRFESGYFTSSCAFWNVEISAFSPCRVGNSQN